MFLRCLSFSRKDGSQRKYLQIVQTYRESGRVRQKIVANLGRLDELIASGTLEKLSDAPSRYVEKKELPARWAPDRNAVDFAGGAISHTVTAAPTLMFSSGKSERS